MTESSPSPRLVPPWWLILIIAVAAAAGTWLGQRWWADPATTSSLPLNTGALVRYPVPKQVDVVPLIDRHGQPWTIEQLRGRYSLVFFGFTHCPDICPAALAMLKSSADRWRAELPADQQPQVVFVSVDPKRDTPEQLGRYVDFFDPAFTAVTASDEVLLPWTRSLGIVYVHTPTGPGEFDYTVDHSGSILLFDPQLQLVGLFRPPQTVAQITDTILRILDSGPAS
jgi:protein SCO1/2